MSSIVPYEGYFTVAAKLINPSSLAIRCCTIRSHRLIQSLYIRGVFFKAIIINMAEFSKTKLYITTVSSTLSTGEGEMVRLIGDALIAHVREEQQLMMESWLIIIIHGISKWMGFSL